jgi:hypothetical protein
MRKADYTTDDYFIKKKDTAADYFMRAYNIKLIKPKQIPDRYGTYPDVYRTGSYPLYMPFAIFRFQIKELPVF